MKKMVSIPLVFFILFTGIKINLAAHYCGGTYIDSKVSFSGKLASCGMEHNIHELPGLRESVHVCQDLTAAFSLNSNYIPSAFPVSFNHDLMQFVELPAFIFPDHELRLLPGNPDRPPGSGIITDVDPELICIFRI